MVLKGLVAYYFGVLTEGLPISGSDYATGNIDSFGQSGAVGGSEIPRIGDDTTSSRRRKVECPKQPSADVVKDDCCRGYLVSEVVLNT